MDDAKKERRYTLTLLHNKARKLLIQRHYDEFRSILADEYAAAGIEVTMRNRAKAPIPD